MPTSIYSRSGKRIFDLAVTIALLPILLPLMAGVALLVRMNLGKPILYRQIRAGRKGERFLLYKFRTMSNQCDEQGQSLPDELRLTKFGKFLRKSSLDELPEFWNILLGQMSLVGPRPLLVEYLSRYTPEQNRRHEVRPGLTGWAQVHGRNAIAWEEKFSLDVWYVDHLNFGLDLRILVKTIGKVILSEGITSKGHASTPEFMGPTIAHSTSSTEPELDSEEIRKAA